MIRAEKLKASVSIVLTAMLFSVSAIGRSARFAAGFNGAQPTSRFMRAETKLLASTLQDWSTSFSRAFSGTSDSKYFTVAITGASGLVGSALRDELGRRESVCGKPVRVVQLKRGASAESKPLDESTNLSLMWNPSPKGNEAAVDPNALASIDAVVHLSGENVATGMGPLGFLGIRPWTDEKKAEIINSRIGPTSSLAMAISQCPSPKIFLCASGVGGYGSDFVGSARKAVDEKQSIDSSTGFLAEISRRWEKATASANNGKNRVVNMRFGVVLSKKGGALAKLFPVFFLGGGGVVGSGDQFFTFISARDIARAIIHTLETPSLNGPVNFCAPVPCTNEEFTSAMGSTMNRPTILPLPAFAVSALFGEMGEEMLLGGVRATPSKLTASGFKFKHPTIQEALKSALEENI
jgi:uncharacterized protein